MSAYPLFSGQYQVRQGWNGHFFTTTTMYWYFFISNDELFCLAFRHPFATDTPGCWFLFHLYRLPFSCYTMYAHEADLVRERRSHLTTFVFIVETTLCTFTCSYEDTDGASHLTTKWLDCWDRAHLPSSVVRYFRSRIDSSNDFHVYQNALNRTFG